MTILFYTWIITWEYCLNFEGNDDSAANGQPNNLTDRITTSSEKDSQIPSLAALYGTTKTNSNTQDDMKGISLEDYYKIFSLLTHIDDVDKVF